MTLLSVCACFSSLSLLGSKYTRNNRRIVGLVVLYAVLIVLKENRRLILPGTPCFVYLYIYLFQD
jgi:hypothetical protein